MATARTIEEISPTAGEIANAVWLALVKRGEWATLEDLLRWTNVGNGTDLDEVVQLMIRYRQVHSLISQRGGSLGHSVIGVTAQCHVPTTLPMHSLFDAIQMGNVRLTYPQAVLTV